MEGDVMRDRFFCRRNLVCFEACSVCEVCGDCDMCVAFGQLDRCQKCTRLRGDRMENRRRLTKAERIEVYQKMDGHCAYCGCELRYEDMQVDHFEPLHCGGSDTVDNMLPACRSCNHYKSTMSIETFRKMVENMPTALMRDSVTYRNAVRFGLVIPQPHQVRFYFESLDVGRMDMA